jgi:hypothetical protein
VQSLAAEHAKVMPYKRAHWVSLEWREDKDFLELFYPETFAPASTKSKGQGKNPPTTDFAPQVGDQSCRITCNAPHSRKISIKHLCETGIGHQSRQGGLLRLSKICDEPVN